ncbi:hypothetical protein F6V30_07885 [Oryzomonas sagensis]|uniref:Lipoprotein n=1 Tax=Oryzomonas sagensis TaxID=2603857 RepID=A0ABQ6TN61_9BACT|nr:hypothetical protein [Oryzomonas sagensis]KAB0670076.1 hypothetical protein F6V30_07885 [Oryzomonas sagensis]
MKIFTLNIIIFTIISMSGCVSNYYMHPDAGTELEGYVVPIFQNRKVTLINMQSFNDNIVILRRAGSVGYANPKEFTDTVIAITGRELIKHGLDVSQNASKVIKISVDYIATDLGWNIESKVIMSVETGDGYTSKYTGIDSKTSWGPRGASDQYSVVLMRAVGEMLSDKKIINYLSS